MRINSVNNAKQLTCVRMSAVFLISDTSKVYITKNCGVYVRVGKVIGEKERDTMREL